MHKSEGLEILQDNDILKSRLGLLWVGKITGSDKELNTINSLQLYFICRGVA
jgi:hypothetical protein